MHFYQNNNILYYMNNFNYNINKQYNFITEELKTVIKGDTSN